MASGSSEEREGIFRQNSTRNWTELSLWPTWKLLPGFSGPPFVASNDKSVWTLVCSGSMSCSLAIMLVDKWRTILCRSDRTGPSLSKVTTFEQWACISPRHSEPCNVNIKPQDAQTKIRPLNWSLARQKRDCMRKGMKEPRCYHKLALGYLSHRVVTLVNPWTGTYFATQLWLRGSCGI